MSRPPDELERWYRRTADDEPPAALERRVLEEARHAVDKRRRSLMLRWAAPLATAAAVILAVGVSLRQSTDGPSPALPASEPATRLQDSADPAGPREDAASNARMQESAEDTGPRVQQAAEPGTRGAKEPTRLEQEAPRPERRKSKETHAIPPAPEPWLARIATLLERGEHRAARRELRVFREHYPEHKLPERLRELAAQ